MAVSLSLSEILSDVLACLGLGLLTAMLRDMILFAAGRSKTLLFFTDILSFALAAVLLQAYAAGKSLSGIPRGYMACAMLLGVIAYSGTLVPLTQSIRFWLYWIISRPFYLLALLFRKSADAVFDITKKRIRFCRKKSKKS